MLLRRAAARALCSSAPSSSLAVFTWGAGVSGALGHGSEFNQRAPKRVENAALNEALAECGPGDVSVACGLFHTAVLVHGRVFVFGRGSGGRLGLGDDADAHAPVQLPDLPSGDAVEALALGGLHTALLTRSELRTCGFGGFGALGLCDYKPRLTPARVPPAWAAKAEAAPARLTAIAAGGAHTLAVASDGALWAWGRDEGEGRLGVSAAAHADGGSNAPLRVPLQPESPPPRAAAAGGFHSLVLLGDDGQEVLSFGGNANGELGREGGTWTPAPVPALRGARVVQLAAGGFHSAALTADGELYTWGGGGAGALGHGAARSARVPTRVGGPLAGVPLAAVACGGASTLAVGRDGSLWCWGKNQVRMGSTSGDVLTPQPVALPAGVHALAVAAGSAHAALLCRVTA